MFTFYNPTSDLDVIIVFVNFSKQNYFVLLFWRLILLPPQAAKTGVSKADYQS